MPDLAAQEGHLGQNRNKLRGPQAPRDRSLQWMAPRKNRHRAAASANGSPQSSDGQASIYSAMTVSQFRAAVRHSRHVRILRVAIPLTTVVVFLSGVAFTVLMKPLRVLSDGDMDHQRQPHGGRRLR